MELPCKVVAAVLLVAAAGVGPPATAAPGPRPQGVLAGESDLAVALDLETKMADHFRVGHAVPVLFRTSDHTPGEVVATPYWGDAELWTGVYLGGQAMRYALASQYAGTGPDEHASDRAKELHATRVFWAEQKAQALSRVRDVVEAFHRDITIAEDWEEELRVPPAVNTQDPTGPHSADFGGGVVKGERGMVTRGCTPVELGPLGINPPNRDAANPINDHSNHVYEITWTHGDGRTYNCETSPSRDTYAGLTFGLLTAYDLVAVDDPAMAATIRQDLLDMAAFLVKHAWNFPRPNGYVGTRNDEDGFITPIMAQTPSARLNIVNAARHVAGPADRPTWDALWAEELASQAPLLPVERQINTAQPSEGYFKFNLDHLTGFNVLRTTSGAERDVVARAFAVMDKSTRDDGNAHFEALTYGLTGETGRRDLAVAHLRDWTAYRAATAGGAVIRNSARCGDELSCTNKDRADLTLDQAPDRPLTWYPGMPEVPPLSSAAGPRAVAPLPVAQRPPGDFLWQEPPTKLDGSQSPTAREPGIDYLTPYWMVRYFDEVARPALQPFPAWAGPASS